jgi:hypothetical protein
MSSRDTRREDNQELFRMANARLSDVVYERVPEGTRLPFLCECADEFCDARVEIDQMQWQEVAARTNQFIMVAGHPRAEGEQVVGALDGYNLVQKPD